MADPADARSYIQGSIRAEKARRNMTFGDLSQALKAMGITQSATNLSTKVGRGNMSAQLFLAIMKALGKESIDLREIGFGSATQRKRRK